MITKIRAGENCIDPHTVTREKLARGITKLASAGSSIASERERASFTGSFTGAPRNGISRRAG
jgi:hypothetical protein